MHRMLQVVLVIVSFMAVGAGAPVEQSASTTESDSLVAEVRKHLPEDDGSSSGSAPIKRSGDDVAAQQSDCFEQIDTDPAGDSRYIDVGAYGVFFDCDANEWTFALSTYDSWVRDELDYAFFFLDTDGTASNGCNGGDYIVGILYDLGLAAGVIRTPSCDSDGWTDEGDAYAERAGAIDFIAVTFGGAQIGNDREFDFYGAVSSTFYDDIDFIPDVGTKRIYVTGGPTPPPPPPPDRPTEVRVTSSMWPGSIGAGRSAHIFARISPAYDGAYVDLERYESGFWSRAGRRYIQDSSEVSFTVREPRSGVFRYRIVSSGNADYSSATGPVHQLTVYEPRIVNIVADPPGRDARNLNGEYVVVKNVGTTTIPLGRWSLRSGSREVAIPKGALPPGARVRIHSGSGRNTARDRYLGRRAPLWPDAGGRATLVDANGIVVGRLRY